MKPPRKTHNTSDSCSCTSCLYRSESDRPSLQRLILKQSKIDRLYYGKYVPLREKKLLDKLVRTRAVYDDIRAQLVSDSASSLQKNADFNTKTSSNELQKSSAILEIINLVDKGAALKTPNLSECCSCCSCSSKTHLHQNKQSRKLHYRKHARDHYEREGLRYNMKKRKGVRFLPKHIKSDPCTCTFEYLGFSNKNANLDSNIESSLNIDEEIQPRPRKPLNIVESKTKIKNIITDGLQKIKDSKTLLQDSLAIRAKESLEKIKNIKNPIKKLPEEDFYILENRKVTILKNAGRSSYEKIKASQTRLKNKIIEKGEIVDVRRRNSINKLKQLKNNINTNVKRSLDKLIIKKKPKKKLNVLSAEQHTQLAHKIRKDSIAKFKEDLRKKKQLQDWICEEPCIQGTCDPTQCLKKLKLKRNVKERRRGRRDKGITHVSKSKRRDENDAISSNSSNVRIQTRSRKKASKLQQKTPKDNTKKLQIKPALSIKKLRNKEKFTKTQAQKKDTKLLKKQLRVKSSSERESMPRQVVRIGSSFSFNVEFFKENPRSNIQRTSLNDRKNNNQSSGLTLNSSRKQKSMLKKDKKRSQASLKLLKHELAKKLKHLQKHRQTALQKSESVQCECLNESLADRQNNKNSLLPFECEPSICIPGICDPGNCLKLIQKRLATRSKQSYTSSRKTKSTSSVTTKSKSSKAKQVQSAIIPRRKDVMEKEKLKFRPRKINRKPKLSPNGKIVRIGSTFSFNIEFKKESKIPHQKGIENWQELNTFSIKPKTKQLVRDKKPEYLRRDVYRKEKNFKRRTSTTGTETDYSSNFKTRNTSTGTKNIQYLSQLLPYECTPGTCIPGECNPYDCLEKIKKRHNTREVSLGTLSPENKSTYSDTKNKSKAAFVQFKPSTKGRKILVKSKTDKLQNYKPNFGSMALKSNAKQVVNIGSTFSFNVEFSKSYSKKDIEKDLNPSTKLVNFSTRKKVKERGVEIEKKVGHVDTQMEKVRKAEKSSLVGPILKRCFCTLNLYKKQKNDLNRRKKLLHANTTYTVNTALLPEQQYSSIYLKKMQDYYDDVSGQQSKLRLLPCQKYSTKQSLEITSSLSVDVKLIKKSLKYSKKNLQQISTAPNSSKIKKIESFTVYGLSKYLKRCFCTMNMQNVNTFRKLKPYECEPGVCIPGECDPYECQKLIMRRLVKGYSKVSSTDSKPISISSSQTQKSPSQSHFTNAEFKSQHKTKEHYRQSPPNVTKVKGAKQSVRIGSSFSFDVEFYKNRSRRDKPKTKVNISTSRSVAKSKGTPRTKSTKHKNKTIYTKHDNRESVSQVNTETKHNETNAQDDISRCFCTLKLHNKSKVKTSIGHNQTMPYQQTEIFTESRGQNTKGFIRDQHLLPYECEPGICIPGECNPYECLARINRRNLKETGMATITASTAASSNTIRPKKKLKSRAVKVKEIKSKIQPIRRVTPAGHRKSNKTSVNTNRQAVKIGSNFSFNIDFYKDGTHALKTNKGDKVRTKRSKQSKRSIQTKSKDTKHKGKKISTAFLKSQTKVLQTVQSPHKNMATMVKPFLKRCFCTLQLRNQQNVGTESNKLKKKVYRSVMTMTDKRKLDPNECEPGVCIPYNCDPYECEKLIKKRLNQEMNVNMITNPNLLPYECEPNFCIPGKCDPYVCLERIKKRNLKSTQIGGDKKSIGRTERSSVQNEHTKLQFRHPSIKKTLKSKQTLENTKTQRKSKFSKEVKRSNVSHRTLSDTEIHMKPIQKSQKILKQKHIQEGNRRSSNQSNTLENSKSIKSEIISNLQRCFCTLSLRKNNTDDKSQIVKEKEIQTRNQWPTKESVTKYIEPSQSTASAVGTFIKKCFCTLKLNTRKVPKSPQVKLRINPQKPKNQPYKLEPYECEPNTCIPGDCDPYECEKRIKKRLLRENAADPMKLKYTSKSTFTPTSRTKNISRAILAPIVKTNNSHTHRVPGIKSKSSSAKKVAKKLKRASDNKRQNKQSVRIGSSFSFDIEFFKDKSGANGDTPYHRKTKDVINLSQKRATKENKMQKNTGHTKRTSKIGKAQGTTITVGKYNASQLAHSPTKSSSTITDPTIKRCFCTLQLQNAAGENNNQNIPRQREQLQTQNKTTHTNVSYNVSSPYECPPFMCIPNQCDPYDCARKLEKLNVRNQGIGTKERRRMHQSVEVKHFPKQKKSQKTQSYINKKPPTHDHEQGIVEIPRFTNYLKKDNRQGVKFGSNMSFNIEFYKEFTSPTPVEIRKLKSKENKIYTRSKPIINKHVDSNVIRKRFTDKIVPSIRSDARNTESQVYKSSVDSKASNTTNKLKRCFCTLKLQKHKTASNVPYPQSFEVRRAVVKKYKENPLKETFSQVKCVNIQGVCKNVKINSPDTNPKNNEMQTILSYKPKKFNKKCSETFLLENNIKTQSNKKRITWTSKKRLTKKQSAHPINVSTKPYDISTTQLHQSKYKGPITTQRLKHCQRQAPSDDIRSSYSDRRTKVLQSIPKIRTSKSLMLSKRSNTKKSKYINDNIHHLVGNQLEAGDAKGKHFKFGCKCLLKNNKDRISTNINPTKHKSKEFTNKVKSLKLSEIPKEEMVVQKDGPCPYCGQCVKGGIGNICLTKINSCMHKIKQWSSKQKDNAIAALIGTKEIKSKELKPLFNVYLEADGLSIINKEEVTEKVTRLQTRIGKKEKPHDKYCTCCLCLGKKGKNKRDKDNIKKEPKKSRKNKRKDEPICVCGSKICAKDVKRLKKSPAKKKEKMPCFCGSPICAEETAMMEAMAQGPASCICQEEYEKRKERDKDEYFNVHRLLSAKFRREDSERRKRRRKADQRMKKSIEGNKNDALLVAGSVFDVAKLGFSGVSDMFRIVYRCARDPKHTWHSMKAMAKDPSLIGKTLRDTFSDSNVAATSRRIGMRISNMGSIQKTKELLEQNAMTNFILHMADKNPKKHLRKRKKKPRTRDQVDSNCNLYLSSLRKRPFMWIFKRCPAFYPHCLSFLNVWKQFAEVMAFLLAAVVWSPCIFAMEVCRAVICCTLCTG